MKPVIIDIDNTLTDLQYTLDVIARIHDKDPIPVDAIDNFRLAQPFGLTEEEERDFWETHEYALIDNAPLSEIRAEAIYSRFINEETEVHLVSNRDPKYQTITETWANRYGLTYDTISCIGKQDKADWVMEAFPDGALVVEDNPDFFNRTKEMGYPIKLVCIDYPYNKDCEVNHRLERETGDELYV